MDSGITATELSYPYSYHVARWLLHNFPKDISIDWDSLVQGDDFDNLVARAVSYPEIDFFESGRVTSREWLQMAMGTSNETDISWLLKQMNTHSGHEDLNAKLYDAAEVPVRWRLNASASRTGNVLRVKTITPRAGMRRVGRNVVNQIAEPLKKIRRLSVSEGRRVIDVGMAALAARHRETYHFVHANPEEVYLADVGEGVAVAVIGLLPQFRFVMDCTMGYMILANGSPIGYGGASAVFHQINTGINLLEEYRGSEAAYLWVQVLRTYHQLFGCTHFIANPYQLGHRNSEALKSGAFWFYHRLGFRSVDRDSRSLAAAEMARMKRTKSYRSDIRTVKQLARYDVHLRLRGATQDTFFKEQWLEACSAGATKYLAHQLPVNRSNALRSGAARVARILGIGDIPGWTREQREGFQRMASITGVIDDLDSWPARDKHSLARLMKAKGGRFEKDYIKKLQKHERLRRSLAKYAVSSQEK